MTTHPPLNLVRGLGFPECPRWHDGRIWVSDMMTGELLEVAEDGKVTVAATLPGRPGGSVFLADGSMLVVSLQECRVLRRAGGVWSEWANLADLTDGWLNEMVADDRGRVFVTDTKGARNADGTVTVTEQSAARPTRIMTCGYGQDPRVVAAAMEVANGLVITPDGRTLIAAETVARRLTAFTIDADGSLGDRRLFAELPDEIPNGITLDAEGAVWVASHNGRFLRVREGGEIVDSIDVLAGPSHLAVACVLGGTDGRSLYMTTAEFGGRRMPSQEEFYDNTSRTGRLDVVRVDVPGVGSP